MPSNPSQTGGHLSPGFLLRYLIGAVANPDCLASYPATVEQLQPSTQTSNVTVVLHTSFLASTDDRDECFGAAVVADLTWGLYLVALTALFAGRYVVLAIRTALWRIHPLRWLRAVTALQVLTGVLALAAFIGFAIGGSTALVSLAVVLLAGFVSSHVARLHAYVLAAFPIPIGVDVALQLRHDGYSSIGVVITVLISVALGGFLLVKAYQVMHRGRRSPAHAAVS